MGKKSAITHHSWKYF